VFRHALTYSPRSAVVCGNYWISNCRDKQDGIKHIKKSALPCRHECRRIFDTKLTLETALNQIARRSNKVYEGSAVNINYVSGSTNNIETMSLSRRAVKEGQRALIVDDFLKGGGTAKGMVDLMGEFNVTVVGMAFVMATTEPVKKRVSGAKALMTIEMPEDKSTALVRPSDWLAV
jgi:hypothetical protein